MIALMIVATLAYIFITGALIRAQMGFLWDILSWEADALEVFGAGLGFLLSIPIWFIGVEIFKWWFI